MVDPHEFIPILELCEQLIVPLQGDLGDAQADRLREDVLSRIRDVGASGLVVDVSGVWLIDSHLCSVLASLAASARYMGARTVICGLSPDIVMTLQTMGVELQDVETARSLEEGLQRVGVSVTRRGGESGGKLPLGSGASAQNAAAAPGDAPRQKVRVPAPKKKFSGIPMRRLK